jgi:hypothetical protein
MLIKDTATGQMDPLVLDEKVLSAIIEIRVKDSLVGPVLSALNQVQSNINTVMSVGIAARCTPDGSVPYASQVKAAGFSLSPNGKCNVGLGRPLYQEAK